MKTKRWPEHLMNIISWRSQRTCQLIISEEDSTTNSNIQMDHLVSIFPTTVNSLNTLLNSKRIIPCSPSSTWIERAKTIYTSEEMHVFVLEWVNAWCRVSGWLDWTVDYDDMEEILEEVSILGSTFQRTANLQFGHSSITRYTNYGNIMGEHHLVRMNTLAKFWTVPQWWHQILSDQHLMDELAKKSQSSYPHLVPRRPLNFNSTLKLSELCAQTWTGEIRRAPKTLAPLFTTINHWDISLCLYIIIDSNVETGSNIYES